VTPAGAGTFYPNGQLAFPRSYIWGFNILVNNTVTQDGRFFHFVNASSPSQVFTVSWKENVFDWSSNRYTLDYVIDDSYYQNLPDLTKNPMTYALTFYAAADTGRSVLYFYPFGLGFVDDHFFQLPPAPPDYWRPPFP